MTTLPEGVKFKIHRYAVETTISKGVRLDPERFHIQALEKAGFTVVKALLDIATMEEEVADYPDNFLTRWGQKWQNQKRRIPRWLQKRMPKWLRKRLLLKYKRVYAMHKFPEVDIPPQMLVSEFVHFRRVNLTELVPKEE
mgnify:FL=1